MIHKYAPLTPSYAFYVHMASAMILIGSAILLSGAQCNAHACVHNAGDIVMKMRAATAQLHNHDKLMST